MVLTCPFIVLYIFWLLHQTTTSLRRSIRRTRCISFDSYIKPQLLWRRSEIKGVVYLLTPTSNHNSPLFWGAAPCVVYLLTPTSNHNCLGNKHIKHSLYIFWLLHQTTTVTLVLFLLSGCISFDSYIKPQLCACGVSVADVVYLLTPTSNHNLPMPGTIPNKLYIFWLLHQTTTPKEQILLAVQLYIFWLLHQTTT